jgi:amidase
MTTAKLVTRDRSSFAFAPGLEPRCVIEPGEEITVETHDARAGALLGEVPGRSFPLAPPGGRSNPLTGPIAVVAARPGDALRVTVLAIEVGEHGWSGSHAHVGGFAPGSVPAPLARVFECTAVGARLSDTLTTPLAPMIGCIGTAPGQARSTESAGTFGGNMDHPVIRAGAVVHLPVAIEGAHLFVGDVHALQGDGELSGLGLEIPARVTLRVELCRDARLSWPWIEAGDRVIACAAAPTFEAARNAAVGSMLDALTAQLRLEPADAMTLISLLGDLRLGAAWGAPEITVRLELPASSGVRPPTRHPEQ